MPNVPTSSSPAADINSNPSRRHPISIMNQHQYAEDNQNRSRRLSTTKSVRSTHTLSTNYNKQPSWRTGLVGTSTPTTASALLSTSPESPAAMSASSSNSRAPHPQPLEASVSIVFAEREHGAPLASARDSTRHRLMSLSTASSSSGSGSLGRRNGQAETEADEKMVMDGLSLIVDSPTAAPESDADANVQMPATTPSTSFEAAKSYAARTSDTDALNVSNNVPSAPSTSSYITGPDLESVPHSPPPQPQSEPEPQPPADPPPSTPPSKLNKKSSWFSSLTRSKGKSTIQAPALNPSSSAPLSLPLPSSTSSPLSATTSTALVSFTPPQDSAIAGTGLPQSTTAAGDEQPGPSKPALRVDPPTPVIAQEPVLPPPSSEILLSPSSSNHPTSTAIPHTPPPPRAERIPAHGPMSELTPSSAPGSSISLPSSPLKHHHLHQQRHRHLFDDSPSSSPGPGPGRAVGRALGTGAAGSSTTSLPIILSTPDVDSDSSTTHAASQSKSGGSTSKSKSQSKTKAKAKRSWFYSSPPTPTPSPPRSEPATPPPGYASLSLGPDEEEDVVVGAHQIEWAHEMGLELGLTREEGGEMGGDKGKGGLSFEGFMEDKTQPVHAAPATTSADQPQQSSNVEPGASDAIPKLSSTSTSSSTLILTATSTSTPGPPTPSSPSSPSAIRTSHHPLTHPHPRPQKWPHEQHRSTPSLPSSIDDSVPSLPHTPPASSGSGSAVFSSAVSASAGSGSVPQVQGGAESKAGSASRFMLGIPLVLPLPLLGRAKAVLPGAGAGVRARAGAGSGLTAGGTGSGSVGASGVEGAVQSASESGNDSENAAESGAQGGEEGREQGVHAGGGGGVASTGQIRGAEGGEDMGGTGQGVDVQDEKKGSSADTASPSPTVPSLSTATPGIGTTSDAERAKNVAGPDANVNANAPGNASWWDYVGWTSAAGTHGEGRKDGTAEVSVDAAPAVCQETDAREAEAAAKAEVESAAAAPVEPGVVETPATPAQDAPGADAKEGAEGSPNSMPESGSEDAKTQTGAASPDLENNVTSAWLAPWAWYYSSSSTRSTAISTIATSTSIVVDTDPAGEEGQEGVQEEEKAVEDEEGPEEPKLDSGDGTVVPYSSSTLGQAQVQNEEAVGVTTPDEHANPIMSTMDGSRLGWASFFSTGSNRLLVKTLASYAGAGAAEASRGGRAVTGGGVDVKRDENGMEVMDIDEDEDEDADTDDDLHAGEREARGRAVARSADTLNAKAKAEAEAKPNVTSSPNGARSRSKASDKRAAPVLIVSADLKRESARLSKASTPRGSGSGANTPVASGPGPGPGPLSPSSASSIVGSGAGGGGPASSVDKSRSSAIASGVTTTTTSSTSPSSSANVTATTTTTTTMSATNGSAKMPSSGTIKRGASPAPSTKKASSSSAASTSSSIAPPTAPPPNLVLPTWSDTFHVPPRSILPPRPPPPRRQSSTSSHHGDAGANKEEEQSVSKLLGKTMKFVSGVLFARDAPAPAQVVVPSLLGGGKGKQRAKSDVNDSDGPDDEDKAEEGENEGESALERYRREQMRGFGMELPKAWKVYEDAGWDIGFGSPPASSHSASSLNTSRSRSRSRSMSMSTSTSRRPRMKKDPSTPAVERINDTEQAFEHELGANGHGHGASGMRDVLRGCKRVVVIGVHGWFPGAMIRTVLGEPTGTSSKFANMTEQALHAFEVAHGVKFEKITKIPLEGEGVIERRVERLYSTLLSSPSWLEDVHAADAVLIATHSQGSVVSAHLVERMYRDGHLVGTLSAGSVDAGSRDEEGSEKAEEGGMPGVGAVGAGAGAPGDEFTKTSNASTNRERKRKVQRVCCLALCGIHLGPLRYLSSSTLVGPYLQYFESTAARELFEFQNTESAVSKAYVKALQSILDNGTKIVYIASLNDQVVPLYSGLFTAASHPLILRALYIDGDAYHSSDFLSALLVLLLRIRNAGLSDSGLLAHLSEATAGSLNGVGHSTAYEEEGTYRLAVDYLFLAADGLGVGAGGVLGDVEGAGRKHVPLSVDAFNAAHEQNDYEIPWALRDIIADERVAHFFAREIADLRDAFREWHPKTSILRDLKRKLQPIQRLGAGSLGVGGATSWGVGVGVGASKL